MEFPYERVILSPKTVAGIGLRTPTLSESAAADIGGLWSRFYRDVFHRIPHKTTGRGIGLYHHYESDHLGGYDMMACCEVSDTEDLPADLLPARISGGPYARFILRGDVQKDVAAFWRKLWTMDLPRAYTTDFEEYICGSGGPENMEIHIYIALKEGPVQTPVRREMPAQPDKRANSGGDKSAFDFKRAFADLYRPAASPSLIQVPPMTFAMVDGAGDPASDCYQQALRLLYALSFSIKMRKKSGRPPEGYYDYVMPPLEGLWWSEGDGLDHSGRSGWRWTSMIRQPEFVTQAVWEEAVKEVRRKKPDLPVESARLAQLDEGLCIQALHLGPYVAEGATIEALSRFAQENGLAFDLGERKHHEIYLSDPRRTRPDRLKTVLRIPVQRTGG